MLGRHAGLPLLPARPVVLAALVAMQPPNQVPPSPLTPQGTLFPMCGMNLAFDRHAIGPAMYFGLMGEGQPWGRYDDMWAGWCVKVIADHLGLGVKTGLPYIWHSKASNPFVNLRKEYKGIFWQEEIIPFFQAIKLDDSVTTVEAAMLDIAERVRGSGEGMGPSMGVEDERVWTCAGRMAGSRGLARGCGMKMWRDAGHCCVPARARSLPPHAHPTQLISPSPQSTLSQVRKGLAHLDPYFEKLADGIVAWIEAWRQLNPEISH